MRSIEQIKRDNHPRRTKGEVAAGRARRKHTVLTYAKMQLDGAEAWGDDIFGTGTSLFVCRKCREECHVDSEFDPCAYCNDCKDAVLDMLAEAVVNAATKTRRARSKR